MYILMTQWNLTECQPCVHGREVSAHILLGGV